MNVSLLLNGKMDYLMGIKNYLSYLLFSVKNSTTLNKTAYLAKYMVLIGVPQ
jgi:hypothetical protein